MADIIKAAAVKPPKNLTTISHKACAASAAAVERNYAGSLSSRQDVLLKHKLFPWLRLDTEYHEHGNGCYRNAS